MDTVDVSPIRGGRYSQARKKIFDSVNRKLLHESGVDPVGPPSHNMISWVGNQVKAKTNRPESVIALGKEDAARGTRAIDPVDTLKARFPNNLFNEIIGRAEFLGGGEFFP